MIDRIRGVVLSILKKENKGWITPEDFNRFGDLSQLEIFEDYFYEYNRWLLRSNRKMSHSGLANMPKILTEKINVFLVDGTMTYASPIFSPPSNCYRLETVYLSNKEIDEVTTNKIGYLLNSELTAPTETYPIYIRIGKDVKVYPTSVTSGVTCFYLRRPLSPKWTYMSIAGNPVFNIGANDYQDFEIHPSDEIKLVTKILSKAGLSIRDEQVVQYIEREEQIDTQLKNN